MYAVLITTGTLLGLAAGVLPARAQEAATPGRTLEIDFGRGAGMVKPRTGFLGGLRDGTPDTLVRPLHPSLWRIGHQFRGRVAGGLTAAIDRVESLGAKYKLVMSDLINSQPTDWAFYEADVKKLAVQVGKRSSSIIWEPVNEPDISHKPIERYYEVYAHAFKALREADPKAQICGPGFAFPSYDKYRAFLDYCKANGLECNYLAWHYTGWDANWPEQAKWDLGRMNEFRAAYPAQKIREIHCDEWGAGPDKPGRLHPGRAVVWFHYLEDVYRVDRACRANWGGADDYLGGIVTEQHEPHPVYHVYRWYGETAGQTRVPVTGNDRLVACLASKSAGRRVLLVGSIAPAPQRVTLLLKRIGPRRPRITVRLVPNTDLEGVMTAEPPVTKDYTVETVAGGLRLTLNRVEENQAYQVTLTGE